MVINGYTLKEELKNANSGFSKWGFGTKGKRTYFIKELITPVYPVDKSAMSEAMFQKRVNSCLQYEARFKTFFEKLNSHSHGNLVRIEDFFRCGSRYYLVSRKIEGNSASVEFISTLSEEKKRKLLISAAYCFCDLHDAGIVHFDVKPANIMVSKTKSGNYAAKVIDFDSGFMKGEKLTDEDLGGDLTYLAPETFLAMQGEDVTVDEKTDIFALGLIFHEYYGGSLPFYDKNEYVYPYEVVLDGNTLMINKSLMPGDIAALISDMLSADAEKRPSAKEIVARLKGKTAEEKTENFDNISVYFGGKYGKSVILTKEKIYYSNILHPSLSEETKNFPAYYTERKEVPITSDKFNQIVKEVLDAGLIDILDSYRGETDAPGAVWQGVTAVIDGVKREFFTKAEPDWRFKNLASILERECNFPKIDSSWYEKHEENAWFSSAGDL